ncbi:DUF6164 family protein [Methylomonas albis]|uniref:DUF2007 domain-containing protein n=1 Tax=Methylomonas albis TaxID=1854563 RepID=A0ABR9D5U6_9GAMM|nr:DUF6164 family protein [Methylomonas albis]MBD9357232.1 hypothetical protein [Methylomonas albis]
MTILFFSLRGVPADEADDVRQLLADNDIEFYETSPGNWGISTPAIWLYQREDLDNARQLFDEYQQQRALAQQALYRQTKAQGEYHGFLRHNLNKPLRFLGYSLVIGLVFYVSVKWLFELGL